MANHYVTAGLLKKRGACPEEVLLFRLEFGSGRVLVNEENVARARSAGIDVLWPAKQLFWMAGCDTHLEIDASSLRSKAIAFFVSDEQVVSLLAEAAPLWARYNAGER